MSRRTAVMEHGTLTIMRSFSAIDSFSGLPAEIIDNICSFLPKESIIQLALCCRMLRDKCYFRLAALHFRVSRFMFTKESLEILCDFAEHRKFGPVKIGPAIKTLELVLVAFTRRQKEDLDGQPRTTQEKQDALNISLLANQELGPWRETETADDVRSSREDEREKKLRHKRRRLYGQYQTEQNTMRTQSKDVELLTRALKHLPNLQDVVTLDCYQADNIPWGLRSIVERIGTYPVTATMHRRMLIPRGDHTSFYITSWKLWDEVVAKDFGIISAHSIGVVLGAIRKSNFKLRGALRLSGAPHSLAFSKDPATRRLSPTSTPGRTFAASEIPGLKQAFSELKEFSVDLFNYTEEDGRNPTKFCATNILQWLFPYFPLMPSLQRLDLTGGMSNRYESIFFRQFIQQGIHFPKLRQIALNNISFDLRDLTQIVLSHSVTLEVLRVVDRKPNDFESRVSYLPLLTEILNFPAMVTLDLRNEDRTRWGWTLPNLPGINKASVLVEGQTPLEFQLNLAIWFEEFQSGGKTPVWN